MVLAILAALLLDAAPADLAVSGVVLRDKAERSTVILSSGGRTRVVGIGDTAFGGRVVAVTAEGVTLEFDGVRQVLRLPNAGDVPNRSAPPLQPARAAAATAPIGAPPEDPQTPARTMERAAVEKRLADEIPRILAETAVMPVMEDGRVAGVQLARIPEGSLLTDAGLRVGDVIRQINGTDIDGMGTLVGLWPRLQSATELRAVVVRNGQPVSIVVSLR
jgi:general secretion pathway protein C